MSVSENITIKKLNLMIVGEIGEKAEISKPLHWLIVGLFFIESDEIKQLASIALGKICIGNVSSYLPFILEGEARREPETHLFFLVSLRELVDGLLKFDYRIPHIIPFAIPIFQQL
ncbi:unnamed protein product [Diabrotica balteata]|uniref:Uncharacterized protein n=1 Tax=Diabrotica balteata TaxID=107213 RepID=A0A9N9T0U1_DIABA|nr:unnamed protein product [Diabrotica balteata]